jgi:hypothetical protein
MGQMVPDCFLRVLIRQPVEIINVDIGWWFDELVADGRDTRTGFKRDHEMKFALSSLLNESLDPAKFHVMGSAAG